MNVKTAVLSLLQIVKEFGRWMRNAFFNHCYYLLLRLFRQLLKTGLIRTLGSSYVDM